MPPSDVLALRTALTDQLRLPRFRRLLDAYCETEAEQFHSPVAPMLRRHGAASFANALSVAENYYVSPDMQALATLAAEDFPDDEPILPEDLPSQAGLVYLPERLRLFEMRGRLVIVYAMLWLNTSVWCLTDRLDPEDAISAELRAASELDEVPMIGRFDVCTTQWFSFGDPIPKTITFDANVLPPEAEVEFRHTAQGLQMHTDHALDLTRPPTSKPSVALQLLLAIWRLMQQTLAEVHEEQPERPARKRAQKIGVRRTGITVIQLRRREGSSLPTGRTIDYRTLVRGHWRRVWCGHGAHKYQRAVYVHPHVRGPKDAPLIIRERVNALVR